MMDDRIGDILMEIEVKFGKGRSDSVLVKRGDDPSDLAESFVTKHGLKSSSVPIIAQYLNSTIEDFLSTYKSQDDNDIDSNVVSRDDEKFDNPPEHLASDTHPIESFATSKSEGQGNGYALESFSADSLCTAIQNSAAHTEIRNNNSNTNSPSETVLKPPDKPSSIPLPPKATNASPKVSLAKFFTSSLSSQNISHNSSPSVASRRRSPSTRLEDFGRSISRSISREYNRVQQRTRSISRAESTEREQTSPTNSIAESAAMVGNNNIEAATDVNKGVARSTAKDFGWFGRQISGSKTDEVRKSNPTSSDADAAISPESLSEELSQRKTPKISTFETIENADPNLNNERCSVDDSQPLDTAYHDQRSVDPNILNNENSNNKAIASVEASFSSKFSNDAIEPYIEPQYNYLGAFLDNALSLRSNTFSTRFVGGVNNSINTANSSPSQIKPTPAKDDTATLDESGFAESELVEDEAELSDSSANAEEMYNRLKNHSKRTGSSYQLGQDESIILKSAGSVMNMGTKNLGKNGLSHGNNVNSRSLVGKTVGERLFITAAINKLKKQDIENQKAAELEKSIAESQFKLNKQSKKIVQNLRVSKDDDDVHKRLHIEGVREKELKHRRADDLKELLKPDDWSCSRCGQFHKISTSAVSIHPIQGMKLAAQQHQQKQKQRVCSNCGWNQGEVVPFQPVNIGLTLLKDDDVKNELLINRKQSMQKHHEQVSSNSSVGSGHSVESRTVGESVHTYLYENAKQKDTMQKLNQAIVEESLKSLTFNPSIPSSSKAIISQRNHQPQSLEEPKTNKHPRSNIIAGTAIPEYFSKSAAERLSVPRARDSQNPASNIKHVSEKVRAVTPLNNRTDYTEERMSHTDSKVMIAKSKSEKIEKFVNRLAYEYKEKEERRKEVAERLNKFDPKTGKPLFRPHIPSLEHADQNMSLSLNDSLNSSGYVQHRQQDKDIFNDILRRDEVLKQKRSLNQAKAIEDELKDMNIHQVKALHISNTILKDSREKHIEELYRILVASTLTTDSAVDQIDTDENNISIEDEEHDPANNGVSNTFERKNDFKNKTLDFSLVQTDAMVPEVSSLLKDMRREYEEICRLNRTETFEDREDEADDERKTPILLTFDEFRRLALRAIKHRNGTGKAYVCAPKKKPELALQMVFKNLKEETFHPTIDKTSQQLANRPKNSKFRDVPIEDILQAEGERMKSKVEIARFEKFIKDSKEFTYKPTLFKPPSYVKPKYRGMEILAEMESAERCEYMQEPPNDGDYAEDGYQMQQSGYFEDSSTIFTEDMMSLSNSILHEFEGPTLAPLASMSGGSNPLSRCMVHEDSNNISYLSSGSRDEGNEVNNSNNLINWRPPSTVTVASMSNSSAHSVLDIQPLSQQQGQQQQEYHKLSDGVALDRFHTYNADTSSNSQLNHQQGENLSVSAKPDSSYLGMHMKLSTLKAKNPSHRQSHQLQHQRVNLNSIECGSLSTSQDSSEVEGASYYSEVNPTGSFKRVHSSRNPNYSMGKPPPLPHEMALSTRGSVDDTEYFDSRDHYDYAKQRQIHRMSSHSRSKSPSLSPPPPPPLPAYT